MDTQIQPVWATHPDGNIAIETSALLQRIAGPDPRKNKSDLLYAINRAMLEIEHETTGPNNREKYHWDLYDLLDALKKAYVNCCIKEFEE
jgi:hypothetical protein